MDFYEKIYALSLQEILKKASSAQEVDHVDFFKLASETAHCYARKAAQHWKEFFDEEMTLK
jgi:hypothetical protein